MTRRSWLTTAAAVVLLVACEARPGGAAQTQTAARADTVPLAIHTNAGIRTLRVEVARTAAQQERGLMYRTELAADGGMIFPFDPPRPATFWMKNTPLPLDMIFIRADGTIARIAAQTMPYSLDLVDSGEPVAAVLEIGGGRAAAAGIREGDRVNWPGSFRR